MGSAILRNSKTQIGAIRKFIRRSYMIVLMKLVNTVPAIKHKKISISIYVMAFNDTQFLSLNSASSTSDTSKSKSH